MKILFFSFLIAITFGCGTEVGNGDKQEGQEEKVDASEGGLPNNDPNEGSSPGNMLNRLDLIEAFTNHCHSPGEYLSGSVVTFNGSDFVLKAANYFVSLVYSDGERDSLLADSSSEFLVGLAEYSCGSYFQEGGQYISETDGSVAAYFQLLLAPDGVNILVRWYVEEASGDLVKVVVSSNSTNVEMIHSQFSD